MLKGDLHIFNCATMQPCRQIKEKKWDSRCPNVTLTCLEFLGCLGAYSCRFGLGVAEKWCVTTAWWLVREVRGNFVFQLQHPACVALICLICWLPFFIYCRCSKRDNSRKNKQKKPFTPIFILTVKKSRQHLRPWDLYIWIWRYSHNPLFV